MLFQYNAIIANGDVLEIYPVGLEETHQVQRIFKISGFSINQ